MGNVGFNKDVLTLKALVLVLLVLFGFSNISVINALPSSSRSHFFKDDVVEVTVKVDGRVVSDYAVVYGSNPVEVHVSVNLSEDIFVKSVEGELKAKGWKGRLFLAALRLVRMRVYVPFLRQKVLVENPKRVELNRGVKRFSFVKSVNFDPKEGYLEFLGIGLRLPFAVPSGEYFFSGRAVYVESGKTRIAVKTFTLKVK